MIGDVQVRTAEKGANLEKLALKLINDTLGQISPAMLHLRTCVSGCSNRMSSSARHTAMHFQQGQRQAASPVEADGDENQALCAI